MSGFAGSPKTPAPKKQGPTYTVKPPPTEQDLLGKEEFIKALTDKYPTREDRRRKLIPLFIDKENGHYYYRVNFYNPAKNIISETYFVSVNPDTKKVYQFVEKVPKPLDKE